MDTTENFTIIETYKRPLNAEQMPPAASTIFQRLYKQDGTAVVDCVNKYGDKIWAFSNKYMRSRQEAEALTCEIFQDIWVYAKTKGDSPIVDDLLVKEIAVRRLYKHAWAARNVF